MLQVLRAFYNCTLIRLQRMTSGKALAVNNTSCRKKKKFNTRTTIPPLPRKRRRAHYSVSRDSQNPVRPDIRKVIQATHVSLPPGGWKSHLGPAHQRGPRHKSEVSAGNAAWILTASGPRASDPRLSPTQASTLLGFRPGPAPRAHIPANGSPT